MQPQVTLMLYDVTGRADPRVVGSRRFVVGHGPGCDLVLSDAGILRRHALIESDDGAVLLTSYDAEGRTLLNGAAVYAPVELSDGDVITLGQVRQIEVKIGGGRIPPHDGRTTSAVKGRADAPRPARGGELQAAAGSTSNTRRARRGPLVIALAASALILSTSLCLFSYLRNRREGKQPDVAPGAEVARVVGGTSSPADPPTNAEGTSRDFPPAATTTPAVPEESDSDRQVERAAMQVMRRISSDSQPYRFTEKALRDVNRTVKEYRPHAAALCAALQALRGGGATLAVQARDAGVAPDLVFYTALAQADGGRAAQDPLAAAHAALPELANLRKPIGSIDGDSCLIIVAVYSQGGGSQKSLPLLGEMRKHINDSFRERNVWYLHERGVVGERAYDFVLRFLALGVIAQNPRQYGVEAEALNF